uniref:Uncharacterized protein n=1 Tax=Cacopsylla melanoneura TaxID=428564 RepID=A0A8D8SUE4_9HEMI
MELIIKNRKWVQFLFCFFPPLQAKTFSYPTFIHLCLTQFIFCLFRFIFKNNRCQLFPFYMYTPDHIIINGVPLRTHHKKTSISSALFRLSAQDGKVPLLC